MTTMIVPTSGQGNAPLQINLHVQAEVISAETAKRKANAFLAMNIGHLLQAHNGELILDQQLRWRFDVMLGEIHIDRIYVDAPTGDIYQQEQTVQSLTTSVDVLAPN